MKKFNWGHGIFIAIGICIIALLTLVYKSSNQKIELVTDDYYPKELKYEEQISKQKNTNALESPITIELNDSLIITFPTHLADPSLIKGEVWLYRASDKFYDIKDSINLLNTYSISYPLAVFTNGKYQVIIDWSYEKTNYLFKQDLYIEKN